AARQRPIRLAPNHGYSSRPEWVIEQVRQFLESNFGKNYGTQGLRVWTTIDPLVQNAADSALVEGLARVERFAWYKGPKFGGAKAQATASGTNYLQGLVVSVDARTGEIVAMRGGRSWEDSKFNRVTAARRQPGSAFKPIVYSSAFERGVSPSTVMEDTALSIQLPGSPLYQPKNSDNRFRGPVTVRGALTESINTIAIQLGMQVGLPNMVATAKRFGIASNIPPYPSSAIGAGAVRPIELAGAYTAFANGGLRVEPFLIRRVVDLKGATVFDHRPRGVRTVSPSVAFMVTDLLRDAAEKGTGREARERLPARVPMAGKTGTTNDGTDVWYVGYTPEMVTAVWVGFDKPAPIGAGAFGGTLAAPIWGEMMRDVYAKRRVPGPWLVPAELVTVASELATGLPITGACPPVAARREYFLAGTAPQGACLVQAGRVVAAEPLPDDLLPADTLGVDTARAPTPIQRP
nr:hypothetical protein [Gemmatimonadota bacterium]